MQLSQRERELLEKLEPLDPNDEDDREQLRLYEAELFVSATWFVEDARDEGGETASAWLDKLHREPDEAVAVAYGWPADLSDDEILARLFELNQERAGVVAALVATDTAAAD